MIIQKCYLKPTKRDRKRDCETVILFALHAEDKFFYHKITEYGSANEHRKFILKVSVFAP